MEKLYMNIHTGSVGTKEEWLEEYDGDEHAFYQDEFLVEVIMTEDGWEEVR